MMFRTVVVLTLYIAFCACQDDAKIRRIYSDMDSTADGKLHQDEVYAFFSAMSVDPAAEGLNYFNFDYGWSVTRMYNDPRSVTRHFFNQWDINQNEVLDGTDLTVLFMTIDWFNPPEEAVPSIDLDYEFLPYMWQLYVNATASTSRR